MIGAIVGDIAAMFLAVLLSVPVLADGFVISTNAIPSERRAMLAALCERLEACGLSAPDTKLRLMPLSTH